MIHAGRYRHYKGQEYRVLGCAEHTETGEEFVVYEALYGAHTWYCRPKSLFLENVVVDGKSVPRFTYLGPQ